jgi:hypothetical protein
LTSEGVSYILLKSNYKLELLVIVLTE